METQWNAKIWQDGKNAITLPVSQRPSVMTAMTVGNAVYFSSSIKGQPYKIQGDKKLTKNGHSFIYEFADPTSDVVLALNQCQLGLSQHRADTTVDGQHRTRAACGEPMVYLQWTKDPNKEAVGPEGMRIATYGRPGAKDTPQGMPPCNTPPANDDSMHWGGASWGCFEFLHAHGITAVDAPATILDSPQPDIPNTHTTQIAIC